MKLLRSDKKQFTFSLAVKEKDFLFQILQLYPLVPLAHHKASRNQDADQQTENQRLLEESLADQRRETRRQLISMLEEPGRFRRMKNDFQFSAAHTEMERLLQVLNDVRLGAWLALGSPEELDSPRLDKDNAPYMLVMEGAGFFEAHLLDALERHNVEDPSETD